MRTLACGDLHGAKKALDQVLERANFDPTSDRIVFLGDVADGWPEVPECFEFILSLKNYGYVMGNHDCLSDDTECLTKRGWVKYDNIKLSDEVYSFNVSSEKGEWSEIDKIIIIKSDGELYRIHNNHFDILCTATHRILYWNRTKKAWGYRTINSLPSRSSIPVAANCDLSGVDLSDDELRFIGWVLTDGSISTTKKGANTYTIYQSKPHTIPIIRDLLKRLEYAFTETVRKPRKNISIRGVKVKKAQNALIFKTLRKTSSKIQKFFPEKRPFPSFLYNMNHDQFSVFFDAVILGDGHNYKHSDNCWILYGEYAFLDSMQRLCVLHGLRATIAETVRGDYVLNISKATTSQLETNGSGEPVVYEGDVWCLSVPHTNFMVRRNGKPFFTGNSWLLEYLQSGAAPMIWLSQGGMATREAYLNYANRAMEERHRKLLAEAPYYIEEDDRLFVHGGFNWHQPIEEQYSYDLTWDRHLWSTALYWQLQHDKGKELNTVPGYKEVFIGHTTTSRYDPELKPVHLSNVWNIDQGAGWEGKLTLIDVSSKEYWQSDIVSTLYPNVKGR